MCLRNRKTEIREVTAKAHKEDLGETKKKEYISGATSEGRRVISLGNNLVVYVRDEEAVKNIKKRHPVWHIDSFERRGGECRYHRKDGSILIYARRGTTVRPKKDKNAENRPVTYVIK